MAERFDRIWHNARLATMRADRPDLGEIERGVIAARGGRIVYAGAQTDFPVSADAAERIDCEGRWITPGLVDCHTHLVYGGNRAHEFELRLKGASYEEIARAGGGIVSTVAATRKASEAELAAHALPRLDALIAEGATTVEIKSGYGLDTETEMRQLAAARSLGRQRPVAIRTSFLGAHALPTKPMATRIATSISCARRCCLRSRRRASPMPSMPSWRVSHFPGSRRRGCSRRRGGLDCRSSCMPTSSRTSAVLRSPREFSALSADHLEHTDEAGAAAMAKAKTVAVLLPGAFYFIRETQKPPVETFRKHGVAMALATDCNPGSSPLTSLLLAMNMGATLFRMNVAECLAGVTREGARALGVLDDTGTLEAGKWCDLAIWDIERPAELVYRIGFNPLHRRVWRGQ